MQEHNLYQRTILLLALQFLLVSSLPSTEGAPLIEDITSVNVVVLPFTTHEVNSQSLILSLILFLTGGYLCFLGGIHQRLTIFIAGFYIGSNLTYIILLNAKPDYGTNTDAILLIATVMVGILTGRLLLCCFFSAVYLVGALMGYILSLWLLSWVTNGLIQTNWGRSILILGLVIVGIAMVSLFERLLMVVATAFIGSFAIFIGLDVYTKTEFAESVVYFLRAWKTTAKTSSFVLSAKETTTMIIAEATPQLRGMLIGSLGLSLVGTLIQFYLLRRKSSPPSAGNQLHPCSRNDWKRY